MLILTRRVGEDIIISNCNQEDRVIITQLGMMGNQARLGFEAPPNVVIHRREIQNRIDAENGIELEGNT